MERSARGEPQAGVHEPIAAADVLFGRQPATADQRPVGAAFPARHICGWRRGKALLTPGPPAELAAGPLTLLRLDGGFTPVKVVVCVRSARVTPDGSTTDPAGWANGIDVELDGCHRIYHRDTGLSLT